MEMHFYARRLTGLLFIAVSLFILCSCSSGKAKTPGETGTRPGEQSAASPACNTTVSASETNNKLTGKPPVVKRARFIPETQNNRDILRIAAEGQADEGKTLSFRYEWTKNNEYAGDSDNISDFKKGDKISVKITPFDCANYGLPLILTTEIKKSTPQLTESNQISFDGGLLLYQVKAVSPDGDPVIYSLLDAPPGMDIDKNRGLIKWVIPENASGKQNVNIKISDDEGGELIYTLNINMGK